MWRSSWHDAHDVPVVQEAGALLHDARAGFQPFTDLDGIANQFDNCPWIANANQAWGTPINLATTLGTTVNTGINGQNLAIAYNSGGNNATSPVGSKPTMTAL